MGGVEGGGAFGLFDDDVSPDARRIQNAHMGTTLGELGGIETLGFALAWLPIFCVCNAGLDHPTCH